MVTLNFYKLKIVVWSVALWSDVHVRYMWRITTYTLQLLVNYTHHCFTV